MALTSESPLSKQQDIYAFPASFAQQGLWYIDQIHPHNTIYNLFSTLHIRTAVNTDALASSIQAIIQRHEALRTVFVAHNGQPLQMILPQLEVPFTVVDLEYLPEAARQAEMLRLANAEVQQPFDLAHGPLLRTTLFRLGAREFLLLLTIHHIIYDGWSVHVFFRELAAYYQAFDKGSPLALPALPVQYVDFAVWQREWLSGERLDEQLAYWKQQLAGAPALFELPTDRPRPAIPTSRGSLRLFQFSRAFTETLRALSRQEKVSLFTTLVASFQTLLYRYTGQEDLLLGTDTADRSQAGTEDLIGFFVNTLVLRCDLSGNPTFHELLGRVRQVILEAYAHQDVPIEVLARELRPDRSPGQNPFFQVMLSLDLSSPDLPPHWELLPLELKTGSAKFDLSFEMQDRSDGLLIFLEYNTDLFDETTIVRMMGHWQRLLEGIVADPQQHIADLPLLTAGEWQQQIIDWNATSADFPQHCCFPQLFEEQVARTPDAIAVVFEQERFTYRQLNQHANYLAHHLQDRGVGPETIIPLLAERGSAFIIAMLGIMKAGGTYLPLDPRHPAARLRQVLEHSGSHFLLATKKFAPILSQITAPNPDPDSTRGDSASCLSFPRPDQSGPYEILYLEDIFAIADTNMAQSNLPVRATPRNMAYVIYTSGSTGTPKGVMIEHRGMLNHLYAKVSDLKLSAADRIAQTASQCFDISVWQFLAALLVGGRVHIFPDEVAHHPLHLLEQVDQHEISILETVPSLLRVMLESIENGSNAYPRLQHLRWLIPTGEALPPEFCKRWLNIYPGIPLLNAYGPTECSDDVTHFPIHHPLANQQLHTPIGRPIQNMQLYILDRQLHPVPIGVNGELYVGGIGVGRGYLNDPQRTAESFVPNPFVRTNQIATPQDQSPGSVLYADQSPGEAVGADLSYTPPIYRPSPNLTPESGAKLYKTGDLVRYLSDGTIEFLGRIDHQVKIRGYRIELGEIESALRQHNSVQDVVVIVREDTTGNKSLVAYVVASSDVTANELRTSLKQKLPDYMIPSAIVLLESLPLTPNGKVDRRALPVPQYERFEPGERFVAATQPIQQQLVQIWEELLAIRPIGIQDNFFEIGGHSLLLVRLLDRIEQVFGKKIPIATLLAAPTIEQLAHILAAEPGRDSGLSLSRSGHEDRHQDPREDRDRPLSLQDLLSSMKAVWKRSRPGKA
ncbi:MAG TPA: amino acid adenylation domain-containing protein [Ktedonobacteraceae bacterium]|nr:amino acid adenylation domain-containing protein [Ktedonobacteraceae bacterium]